MAVNDFSNTNNEKLDLLGVFWQNYVGQIKNITEVNDCPSDFKDAFDSYIFASEKAEDLLKNHPPLMEAIDNFLMGFFFFTLFDTDDGYGKKVSDISKWKHKLKNVIDERKEAWERVQTVAIQYGVDISKFD